jgi:uncharacterized oligopeptide transporter (OPT) family protein
VQLPDSASVPERDLTLRALASGLLVGALLCMANLYMGLKTGLWDGGQITASILAFALVSGRLSRLETNVAQTGASAAGGIPAAAGLLGAVPALQLIGVSVPGWGIALWGLALGVVGVLMAVALRRRLLEEEDLPFPTGIATAEVIEALHAGGAESRGRTRSFLATGIAAAVIAWFRGGKPALIPETLSVPGRLAGVPANVLGIGLSTSPLLWGVGILIGPRISIGILGGSLLGWMVLGPWLVAGPLRLAADRGAISHWLSWPATALMVSAALVYLVRQAGLIARALRDVKSVASERSLALVLLATCAAIGTVAVGKIVFGLSAWHTGLALLLSVLGSSICARSAGLADFAPLGTVGQAAQAAYGALAPGQPAVNVAAASVVAGAPAETCMLLWSLKTGRLLRAPVRGQVAAALAGCVVGALLCMPVYGLLLRGYGLTSTNLPMPTALQWKAMGEVVAQGLVALPPGALRAVVLAGIAGIVLAVVEESPIKRFAPPAVAVGIGALLPFEYSLTIFCGAVLIPASARLGAKLRPEAAGAASAGLIAGDSVVGIVVALLRSFGLL